MNYTVIQNMSDLPNLAAAKRVMFDTETSGFNYFHGDRICGFSLGAFDDNRSNFYLPIRHRDCGALLDAYKNLPVSGVLEYVRSLVGDPEKEIVGHHLKFDLEMLMAEGIEVKSKILDTMVYAFDLDGSGWSYELDTLTKRYCKGFKHVYWESLDKFFGRSQPTVKTDEGSSLRNYSLAPIEMLAPYACEDIFSDRFLCQALDKMPRWGPDWSWDGSEIWGLDRLLQNDMKLVKVLAKMEFAGIRVDAEKCARLRDQAEDEVATMNEHLYKLAGHSFQVSSWKQMTDAFCDAGGEVRYWNLPEEEKGKMKENKFTDRAEESTGRPCYNIAAVLKYLKAFRDEGNTKAFEFILTFYRSEQKRRLISGNLEPYLKRLDMLGRIHGQFFQHRVLTGRLASGNPNLQNIAKTKGTAEQGQLEKFLGTKDEDALNRKIRGLFIADPGDVLVNIDYSQLEYRIATWLSQDAGMIAKYALNPSMDYHQETMDIAHVTREEAKVVAFGKLYGMGLGSLAAYLMLSKAEAEKIDSKIMNARPALRRLMHDCETQARMRGFTQNVFGRRCTVPKGFERKALNWTDQGMGGDMMRLALVELDEFIVQNKLPVKMLSSVHDEGVFQMSKDVVAEITPKLSAVMCRNSHMKSLPLYSDADIGLDWGKGQVPFKEWCEKYARAA